MEPQQPQSPDQPVLQPEPIVTPQPTAVPTQAGPLEPESAPVVQPQFQVPQSPVFQPAAVAVVPPVQSPTFASVSEPPVVLPVKKGLSKGALWGIIGGVVGLLLVAAAVIAFIFLAPPSKADYQKAYDKAKSMTSAYNGFDTTSFSDLKTTAEVKQKFSELKAQYDADNTELGSMKAMKDSDVKKAFDGYIQKYNATMPVAEASMVIQVACSDISTPLTSVSKAKTKTEAETLFDTALKDCMSTLKDVSTSSNSSAASYGKALYDYLNAVRTYYSEAIDAYAANNYAAYSKLTVPTAPSGDSLNLSSDTYDFPKAFESLTTVLSNKMTK